MYFSFSTGRRAIEARHRGESLSPLLHLQIAVADRLVFSRLRQLLGGRVKYLISGGAPLAREIAEFFDAAGLRILEGYGLTETTPVLTVNRPDRYRLGTVGQPLDCVTLRLAEDGEILAKGPNIALGTTSAPTRRRRQDADGCSTPETSARSIPTAFCASPIARRT
jgi:long-chain acyl-CoA synthetase